MTYRIKSIGIAYEAETSGIVEALILALKMSEVWKIPVDIWTNGAVIFTKQGDAYTGLNDETLRDILNLEQNENSHPAADYLWQRNENTLLDGSQSISRIAEPGNEPDAPDPTADPEHSLPQKRRLRIVR